MSQNTEGYGTCGVRVHPKVTYCTTCKYAYGEIQGESLPSKGSCGVYSEEKGLSKPNNIYFAGEECQYYEEETDLSILKRYSDYVKRVNKHLAVKKEDPFEHLFA